MTNGTYSLRFAKAEDAEMLLRLIIEFSEFIGAADKVTITRDKLLQSMFVDKQAEALLVFHGEQAVGYSIVYQSYSSWLGRAGLFMEDLYVQEPHRRGGVGGLVLSRLAALCLERGYAYMEWCCRDWNTKAIAFYLKSGAERKDGLGVYHLDASGLDRLAGSGF